MLSEEALSELIADIYRSSMDFSHWEHVLKRVACVVGGNCGVLGISDEKQNFSAYVAPLTDPAFLTSYKAHYHAISPLMPRIRALPPGSVVTDRMVLRREDFVKSDIYNEWILPQGIKNKLYALLLSGPGRRVMLGVHGAKEFDDEQIRLCRLLTPHLQQSMQFGLEVLRLGMFRSASAAALDTLEDGAIIVDEKGEIVLMNAAAGCLFEPGGGLRLASGRVTACRPSEAAHLQKILTRCWASRVPAGQLQLSHAGGTISLVIAPLEHPASWLLPSKAAALILAKLPRLPILPSQGDLQERFGLTRAEAAFAVNICEGDNVATAARRHGIRLTTARTHLAHIFDKTGAHRQAELITLVMRGGDNGLQNDIGPQS
jgi:DNA-binding CsgD family transcriptional regulator